MSLINGWTMWLAMNLVFAGFLAYALLAPASSVKTSLLPGTTTHGHYQIEMDCDACHAPETSQTSRGGVGAVMQDACNRCHAEQLRAVGDTHPAKKFNDPTNADLLSSLDAQNCLTCHREHDPEQTRPIGLTLPVDYCWHCHQDVADSRPSHTGMAYDSCATAGCHNYHDNRAIYEKFLFEHHGEPDFFDSPRLPERNFATSWMGSDAKPVQLLSDQADAPSDSMTKSDVEDWAATAHAAAGVNCQGCHQPDDSPWSNAVAMETCHRCHDRQVESFLTGRHGMRIAQKMSPMTPAMARLPMHAGAAHRELTCNSCHPGHRYDTQYAAAEACQKCHADTHSTSYQASSHAELWKQELAGEVPAGSGVSCATCHLPRLQDGKKVWVNHDQNVNLRPNESMARDVCHHCHGLEFSLSALADPSLVSTCYDRPPSQITESVKMAEQWFARKKRREDKGAVPKSR